MTDNRWATATATCPTCDHQYSQTNGQPDTCPKCERDARMAELRRVLNMKGSGNG